MSAAAPASAPVAGWKSLASVAEFLGLEAITLRRALERTSTRRTDGSVIASLDGVTARKFGKTWRVRLDQAWTAPPPPQKR